MIRQVRIKNFQSIDDVTLDLGKFTVLVGPSNSGKSAVIRALRLVAQNASRTGFVSTWATKSLVSVTTDDGHEVIVSRGKGASDYEVDGRTFAKCGTSPPEEAAAALKLLTAEDGSLVNFASQFDKPFLLDTSGAKVAAELGRLSGITLIYEAVREATRRRQQEKRTAQIREQDVAKLQEQIEPFRNIKQEQKLVAQAEAQLMLVEQAQGDCIALTQDIASYNALTQFIEQKQPTWDLPDTSEANALLQECSALNGAITEAMALHVVIKAQGELRDEAAAKLKELQSERVSVLRECGVCPTCGQEIHV